MLSKTSSIINHYALALLFLKTKKKEIPFEKDFFCLYKHKKYFFDFFCSPFAKEEKIKFFERKFCHFFNFDQHTINFLTILLRKKLFFLLFKITSKFLKFLGLSDNYFLGTIYSSFPLTQKMIFRCEKILSSILFKKVVLKNRIDQQLLVGIKVRVENFLYEVSLSNLLDSLQRKWILCGW